MKNKMMYAYMDVAERFSMLSTANRKKVGSIIVKDDRILSIGYNGTPSGWDNVCEDIDNSTKPEVIHAEANCLAKMARANDSSYGASMFVTLSPCLDCAKQIYAAGVEHIYYKEQYRNTDGLEFLKKCGLNVKQIT